MAVRTRSLKLQTDDGRTIEVWLEKYEDGIAVRSGRQGSILHTLSEVFLGCNGQKQMIECGYFEVKKA